MMNSNHKQNILLGFCVIYGVLALIIFTVAGLLMIRTSLEAQGVLLFLRDAINYIIAPLTFFSLLIASLIGSTIIVRHSKDLSIGIRSIKYFFISILLLNLILLFIYLYDFVFNPASNVYDRYVQTFGVGIFVVLLVAILLSRFLSLFFLTKLVQINRISSISNTQFSQ